MKGRDHISPESVFNDKTYYLAVSQRKIEDVPKCMPRKKEKDPVKDVHKRRTLKHDRSFVLPAAFSSEILEADCKAQFPFHLSKQIQGKWISWLPEKIFVSVKQKIIETKCLNKGKFLKRKKEENIGIPWGMKNFRSWEDILLLFPIDALYFYYLLHDKNWKSSSFYTAHLFNLIILLVLPKRFHLCSRWSNWINDKLVRWVD